MWVVGGGMWVRAVRLLADGVGRLTLETVDFSAACLQSQRELFEHDPHDEDAPTREGERRVYRFDARAGAMVPIRQR